MRAQNVMLITRRATESMEIDVRGSPCLFSHERHAARHSISLFSLAPAVIIASATKLGCIHGEA
jgi:hypothetical protein